ncbi:MAG: hypothetical protein BGO55_15725 [Sphingobacteriales bacterium 50-39]|nr:hypothetical protein [Sphingobacteriales bacterium]OJW54812.1 MAG: hypothetical protein BGO55_15725 [Sphingobacteriales bacterium 50-39]
MKKQFYLLSAGLLLVCIAHAQLKKGDILLGGNVNFYDAHSTTGGTNEINKQTSYSLMPSIGRAVKDGLVVGFSLTYSHNKYITGGTPRSVNVSDTYGLGVFARKYKILGAGFALFGEGSLGGQYTPANNYTEGYPKPPATKTYSILAGFYPGIAYFISPHVQLETGIQNLAYMQYQHANYGQSPNATKSHYFQVGTNFSQALQNFVIGIKWVI